VARRTVFNHFASLDEVVLALCTHEMVVLVDNVVLAAATNPAVYADRDAIFDVVTRILREADLVNAIAWIVRALGGAAQLTEDPRVHTLVQEAFARTGNGLVQTITAQNRDSDLLDVEILVSAIMGGLVVIALRWVASTGASTDEASRQLWAELLETLIASLRRGYGTGA
jgi:AcrR family transcriptional regulator